MPSENPDPASLPTCQPTRPASREASKKLGGGGSGGGGMGVNHNNQGSSKLWEKNKMMATLLAREPIQPQTQPPSQHANPQGLPQEKLPKDLEKKLQTPGPWQPPGHNQSEILTQLLTNRPAAKVTTSIGPSMMGLSPQMCTPSTHASVLCSQPILAFQGHVSSQPSLTSQIDHGVKNINLGGSIVGREGN